MKNSGIKFIIYIFILAVIVIIGLFYKYIIQKDFVIYEDEKDLPTTYSLNSTSD